MNNNLSQIKKLLIISMAVLTIILFSVIITGYFFSNYIEHSSQVLLCIIVPVLLAVIILFIVFINQINKFQVDVVSDNIDLLRSSLGRSIEYNPRGLVPFKLVSQDPSLTAKLANTCTNNHMISGTFHNIPFVATNMETKVYTQRDAAAYSVFEGYYILLNTDFAGEKPIYICGKNFWDDFHHKKPMIFKIGKKTILEFQPEINEGNYKIAGINKESVDSFEQIIGKDFINNIFKQNEYNFSIFIYEGGKIGMAIQNFKAFNFFDSDVDLPMIRNKVLQDTNKIKSFLEICTGIL